MMKKVLRCILLTFAMLALVMAASAEQPGTTALTEIYGYTTQEVDEQFTFEIDNLTGGDISVKMYPKTHPHWVYTYTETSSGGIQTTSPFQSSYADYPGESVVRETLRMALEEGWLYTWQWDDRGLLRQWMIEWDIPLNEALNTALEQGDLSPVEAVTEFFRSCYGTEDAWPEAVTQWHDEIQQLVQENYQGNG